MYAPYVQAGELWRLVTPMFLHMDLMHLGFNMVALYSVGEVLERVLGRGSFLLLYFVGGHHGQRGVLRGRRRARRRALGERRRFDERVRPVRGGARWGLLHKGNRRMFAEYSKGMLGVIGVNVAYTLLVPSVSVSGHLGGALGGLLAMLMVPAKSLRVPNAARVAVAVLWVAALGWTLASRGTLGL